MLLGHSVVYSIIFIGSYTLSYLDIWPFFNLFLLGWSLLGLTSVGHELYHVRDPSSLGFFFLDLWSVRKENWIKKHNKWHHQNVWDEGEDEHQTDGNPIENLWHTAKVLIRTYSVLEFTWQNILLILFRISFFVQISWYAIFIVYLVNTVCVTYLTFIAHAAPVIQEQKDDFVMRQMHRSVDIFPNSQLFLFLTGAFNMHTAHHLCPSVTRDGLQQIHQKMKAKYPDDYRVINTWRQLWNLFLYRAVIFPDMKSWRQCIYTEKRYLKLE